MLLPGTDEEFLNNHFDGLYSKWRWHKLSAQTDENRPASDCRPQELKDLPDSFQPTTAVPDWATKTVFCCDPVGSPAVKQYIIRNSTYLQRRMHKRGWQFLSLQELDSSADTSFDRLVRYYFPALARQLTVIGTAATELRYLAGQNQLITEFLGITGIVRPCLIRYVQSTWHIFYLPEEDSQIDNAFTYYLYNRPDNSISFSKSLGRINADHQGEPIRVSDRVRKEIEELISLHGQYGAVELISRILTELKKTQVIQDPRLLNLAELLKSQPGHKLSKLIIRSNGELFLEDYDITLDLTPLQKTVYLFFLRHPDGIMFKDLAKYRTELESIYRRLSNRTSSSTMKASLDDLVNPFNNSMSEKCSRIKEAFLRHFHKELAQHYYVTGGRLTAKRILLDRSLVIFEDPT